MSDYFGDFPDPAQARRSAVQLEPALTGSPKQVDWANRIRLGMYEEGWPLPAIAEARFWIDNRDAGSLELQAAARAFWDAYNLTFESPFTESFPRTTREEASAALQGLLRLSETCGVIVLDLETSGLTKDDHVVEIAAVRWPSRDVVVDSVVRPPKGTTPAEVTGISLAELEAAPPFADLAAEIAIWPAHHLVTWNTRFDMRALQREIRRAGGPTLRVRATCAMRLAGAWLGRADWPSLEEAVAALGLTAVEPAHRAMADVLTTCAVLDAMASGREGSGG